MSSVGVGVMGGGGRWGASARGAPFILLQRPAAAGGGANGAKTLRTGGLRRVVGGAPSCRKRRSTCAASWLRLRRAGRMGGCYSAPLAARRRGRRLWQIDTFLAASVPLSFDARGQRSSFERRGGTGGRDSRVWLADLHNLACRAALDAWEGQHGPQDGIGQAAVMGSGGGCPSYKHPSSSVAEARGHQGRRGGRNEWRFLRVLR